jgi:hypothetical protein
MPALFFWVINGLPIDLHIQSIPIFGGTTKLEFVLCAFFFPLIAMGLGLNAYRRCENRFYGLFIVVVGLLEFLGAIISALFSAGNWSI